MRQVILLRAAAVVGLLFAIGHLSGGLKKWSPMGDNPVLDQMTNVRFDVMGASRPISISTWVSAGRSES